MAEKPYYFVELELDTNTLKFSLYDLDLIEGGSDPLNFGFETHKLELFSFKGEKLYNYTFYLSPPVHEIINLGEDAEPPELSDTYLVTYTVPYFSNGKEIVITDLEKREQFVVDVSGYAECNEDNICDLFETMETCPEDCRARVVIKEEAEEKKVEEAKKEIKPEIAKKEKKTGVYVGIVVAVLLFVIIGLWLLKKRTRQNF